MNHLMDTDTIIRCVNRGLRSPLEGLAMILLGVEAESTLSMNETEPFYDAIRSVLGERSTEFDCWLRHHAERASA